MSETASPPAAPLVFNPLDPAFLRDPYPTYQRFQAQAPVFRTPLGIWLVTRYDDVQQVLRGQGFEHRFQDMARRRVGDRATTSAAFLSLARWILMMNAPDHTRIRGLMSKAFSVRRIEGLKQRIQAQVDRLVDRMLERSGAQASAEGAAGQLDLMAALARPLPVIVICELLGVPEEDWPRFMEESCMPRHMLEPRPLNPREIEELDTAITSLGDYLGSLCEARRAAPRDDLISALVQAEEHGERLSSEELIANLIMLFFAGHETTVNLIGNGLLALHRHPAELAKLRADRTLVPNAVEEMLRYDNPTQIAGVRCTTEPMTMGGVELPAGSQLVPVIGAANRDPQAFADPHRFDVTRTFTNKPLSFGGGMHFCLGAQLARSETTIVLDTLLRRVPTLAIEGLDAPAWHPSFTLRGLRTLPARLS